jgi:acetyl esterase/lipase
MLASLLPSIPHGRQGDSLHGRCWDDNFFPLRVQRVARNFFPVWRVMLLLWLSWAGALALPVIPADAWDGKPVADRPGERTDSSPAAGRSSVEVEPTDDDLPLPRRRVAIRSSMDGSMQASYVLWPADVDTTDDPRPLVVTLHSWSANVEQRNIALERLALERGWLVLAPDFRGVNDRPEACGSPLAQQDILDAVAWMQENYRVDSSRIYLTGSSGGGHMTLLMAGRHPERWSAVSAWVPITDLAAWHTRHVDEEGGHEGIARAAIEWLAQQTRPTRSPEPAEDNRNDD